MSKPRLLDLFCGAGGCAKGYADAGFEVVGVDIAPQPHYPYAFIQADAMTFPLVGFQATHWSPPCQGYTELNHANKAAYPKLIGAVRERAQASGIPYVIENVEGARREFPQALMLCGSMFGLCIRRHRLFESNLLLFAPCACKHDRNFYSIHGDHVWNRAKMGIVRQDGRSRPGYGTFAEGSAAMGIDWMLRQKELANAIPPAYTAWIGAQLLTALEQEARYA
jgi:DNA (cytosine-5)-methyltransferase 1